MERLAERIAEKAKRKARARHPDLLLTDEEAIAAGLLILMGEVNRKIEMIAEDFKTFLGRREEQEKKEKVVALAKVATLALIGAEIREEREKKKEE